MEDDDAISAVSSDSAAVMPPCSEPSTRLSCSIGTDSDNDDVLSPVGYSTDSDNDDVLSAVSSDFDGLDSSTSFKYIFPFFPSTSFRHHQEHGQIAQCH